MDILHNGKWVSDPTQVVRSERRIISISGHFGGQLEPENIRLHIPEPKLVAQVRWKGWDPFNPEETVDFCKLIVAFDHEGCRVWTVFLKYSKQERPEYMTAPAQDFEVVQE